MNKTDAGGDESVVAPTLEERVSRLEGAYDHLATKADVERLRADVSRWMFQGTMAIISAVGVIVAVAVAFLKLTG